MILRALRRIFRLGVWAGLGLTTIMTPSSGDKLVRPFAPATLVVKKQALPLGPWARTMIVDGRLRLTGAWNMTSETRGFGGLSGVILARGELLFLNDGGALIRLRGAPDAAENRGVISPLPGSCGHSWKPIDRDTESLALTPDGRGLRIATETANGLCAVDLAHPEVEARFDIAAIQNWRPNNGAESMARLPGKAMIIIAEGSVEKSGARSLLWFNGDPVNPATPLIKMRYQPPPGYSPTDATFLPDGRLLVVNRRVSAQLSFPVKLVLVPAFAPAADKTVTGDVLAQIDDPAINDNYEAIAVEPSPEGMVIWLASDNNFSSRQRNLLLRFMLAREPNRARPAR